MDSKQRKILIAVTGTLAVGAIVYRLLRRRSKRAAEAVAEPEEFSSKSMPEESHVVDVQEPSQEDLPGDGSKHLFETIGASIVLPPEWKIAEDISPVPNVAMISIQNVNYTSGGQANEMPGSTPVLVLSVEDNSLEGLDLEEFKEKSKQTAMQQMHMMTNGMVPPRIIFDGAEQNGDFEMVLEYALETTMFQIRVINFITMRDDLAYVFQFMGNGEVFQKEIQGVRDIIQKFSVVPVKNAGPASKSEIRSAENGYSVDVPVNWIIESQTAEKIGDVTRVLALTTASPVKTERVELLKASKTIDKASLENIAKEEKATTPVIVLAGKATKAPTLQKYTSFLSHGISLMEYKNISGHQVLAFASGNFAIRVTPLRSHKTIIKPEILLGVLQSLSASSRENSATYVNRRSGFQFPIKEGSRVVESRVGDSTVTLAPEGIRPEVFENINAGKAGDNEPMPIFTVRCGDPATDKDCESSLDGWMKRLEEEKSRGDVKMIELGYEEVNGMRCIAFSQKEMQETSPGRKEEHQAKIFVLVENGVTYMLRWETATEAWRKFAPSLNRLISSFSIINRS